MTRTWIAILGVGCAFMGWLFLSLLLLLYGNDWWLSGLTTLTVLAWLAGLLFVMFQTGRVRAAATGAVIAAAAYWLLALGPWFGTNVGPTLLSSRCLAFVDQLLHPQPNTQSLAWSYPQSQTVYVAGSPGTTTTNALQATFVPLVSATTNLPMGSIFQLSGHWLLVWFCAALGGGAAFLMQISLERKQRGNAPGTVGESPFARSSPTLPAEPAVPTPGATP